MLPGYINPEMSDFIVQHTTYINIQPNFDLEQLNFISGYFGPFRINRIVDVPLWLAIELKKKNKCRVITPEWLSVENLSIKLEEEQANEQELSQVEQYYYEIQAILFSECKDDIKDDAKVKQLLEDIKILRENKIKKKIVEMVQRGVDTIKINNINTQERNKIFMKFYGDLKRRRDQKQTAES